jgi:hypothetical protein
MNAFTATDDVAVQMIDTSIVRVHQHGLASQGMQSNITGLNLNSEPGTQRFQGKKLQPTPPPWSA